MKEQTYWGIYFIIYFTLMGFFLDKFVLACLCRWARKAQLDVAEVVLKILRKRICLWSIFFAIYVFLHYFVLPAIWIDVIRDGIAVLFILSVTFALSEAATSLITIYARKTPKIIPSTSIFVNFTNSTLFIIAILLILQSFGISVTPLLTALGVGGLAVALALQDTLSNFFAGMHLLIARPVTPGDYIRLDSGEEGYVVDIAWRNTAIEDLMRNMIIVPNAKMTEAKIINYNRPDKNMMIVIPLAVTYEANLEKVEKIALETAEIVMAKINGEDCGIRPLVRFCSFGDNSVEFKVSLCVKQFSSQYYLRHEFIKLLQAKFILANICLPEASYVVKFGDENHRADKVGKNSK